MADDEHKHPHKDEPNDEPAVEVEETKEEVKQPDETPAKPKFNLKEFLASKKGRLSLMIAGGAVLVIGTLFAVPVTRYGILGLVVKKDVDLVLQDKTTTKPISDAEVAMAGQSAKSDKDGKVHFSGVPVGPQQTTIKKTYYKDVTETVNVWLTKAAEPATISVEATGRQVPITVLNKISGQPVEKATITALDATAITDEKGEAVLVLPADKGDQTGSVKVDGYNGLDVTITLTDQVDDKNKFSVIPAGKLYFLSKRTGKINVMKSDLDGTNAQVVVAGTGKEEETGTVLLASRDWKYLALLARRDSDKPKVYLINTSNDKLSVIDEGSAYFNFIGWADHHFVYSVSRDPSNNYEDGAYSLKSFAAESGKLTKLDSTLGGHTAYATYFGQEFKTKILIGNVLYYEKYWQAGYYVGYNGRKNGIYSINADGSGKKTILEDEVASVFYEVTAYKPTELYIRQTGAQQKTYELDDGKLIEEKLGDEDFQKSYLTYLVSPSGNATFWTESRDGKNSLLLGDRKGNNEKLVATIKDYRQYGWFTDDYLLVSKDDSELYILHKDQPDKLLKITDYHRPDFYLYYGGGYGGY